MPLLLPLVVGAAALAFPNDLLRAASLGLVGSIMVTRWTYPVFAIVVLLWSRRWTADQLERSSLWLPLLYAPIGGGALASIAAKFFSSEWWGEMAAGALLTLLLGYFYVGAVRTLANLVPSWTRDSTSLHSDVIGGQGT